MRGEKGNDNAKNCTICISYIPFGHSVTARVTSIICIYIYIYSYLSRFVMYKLIYNAATFFRIHRDSLCPLKHSKKKKKGDNIDRQFK